MVFYVPDKVEYSATRGVQRSVDYFLAHPDLQVVDEEWNRKIDAIIAADRAFHP